MENSEKEQSITERARYAAAELYSPELPYHNFKHAQEVAAEALKIAAICDQEGVPINKIVLELAALFHDAGFHLDPLEEGFQSKEELSAHLAEKTLLNLGADQDVIARVKETILATRSDAPFTTNEQKAIRAADLSNLASDLETFIDNNRRLKEEFEILNNKRISWDDWKIQTEKIINFYLNQDIRLTSHHDDEQGRSIFHEKTKKILAQFLSLPENELEINK